MENIKCKDAENGTHDDTQNDTEIIKIIEDIIENGCNDNIISRLDKVYKNNYRHKYS